MKVRDEIQLNKVLVCEHTGMSEDEYNLFRYELAEKWAEKWIESNKIVSCLLANDSFRGWFNRYYALVEAEFVEKIVYDIQHNDYVLVITHYNELKICSEAWQIKQHYHCYVAEMLLNNIDNHKVMIESLSMLVKHIKHQPVKVLA